MTGRGEIVTDGGSARVVVPQLHLNNRQRALVQRQRLAVLTHGFMQHSKVVEAACSVGVVRAQLRLNNRQRACAAAAPRCADPWLDATQQGC